MEEAEKLAVDASVLLPLNCYVLPERHREELAQVITETAVALKIGQKQRSLWARDFNEEPGDMMSHTLEQFEAGTLDDDNPEASTRFSNNRRLDFFLSNCQQEFGKSRRKYEKLSDHMITEVKWKNGKTHKQPKNTLEPGLSWSNAGTLPTREWQSHSLQAFTKLRDILTAPPPDASDRQAQVGEEFYLFLKGIDELMRATLAAWRTELDTSS